MSYRIAIVGAGPTAIYSVQALLTHAPRPAAIYIFERQRRAGQGTPYSAHWTDPIMLANIASIEIPPLPQSLVEWLISQTDEHLTSLGIVRDEIDDRAFFPRLALGEYLSSQFDALIGQARTMNVEVQVLTQTTVTDVSIVDEQVEITSLDLRKAKAKRLFDYAILATGHQWPPDPELRPGYFTSPWPAKALSRIKNCSVGIRGTSLTAIDAAVALAHRHGEFLRTRDDQLEYRANPDTDQFAVTLFSRKGILPEADFYHPVPYEPLSICNTEAVEQLAIGSKAESLLDEAFELFRRELTLDDPDYATRIGLRSQSLEQFCAAYFDQRSRANPFEWARGNLAQAVVDAEHQVTVQWRYAILRMHEVFGVLAPYLTDSDFTRFNATLKPVFVDNYATVPHESIRRMLALYAAKKISVFDLPEGARFDTWSEGRGATLIDGNHRMHFPVFIEATGQQVAGAKDFPFPSLRRQGVVQDVNSEGDEEPKRGIAIDGSYHPISTRGASHRLFCLSLPFLLGQHPFAQGITSSAEMADVVAEAIERSERSAHAVPVAGENTST